MAGIPSERSSLENTKLIRILLADDFTAVLEGLRSIINSQPDMEVIAEAGDGEAAVEQFRIHRPDVLFLDVRMPRLDGIAAAAEIRKLEPKARIILFSESGGDELIYKGLQAGAKAFLLKDTSREVLLETIRKVNEGETCVSPAIATKLAGRLTQPELSRRELEVLRLMTSGKDNKEIAALLCVTESTVKVHVNKLFKKLHARGRTEAINLALSHGIVDLNS